VVAADSLLVIAVDVVQAPNDKQQIEPMLAACRSWFAGNNRLRVAFPGTPAPDAERGFEFHA
jgi:hypothetical protein